MPRWVVANEDEEENESSEEESEEEEQQEEADNDDRDAAGPSCTREAEEEDVTARAGGLKKKITIPLGRGGLVCHVCGKTGHNAGFIGSVYMDCPNKPCYLCKKAGHTTMTCPYRIAPDHDCTQAASVSDCGILASVLQRSHDSRRREMRLPLPGWQVDAAVLKLHSRRCTCLQFHPRNDNLVLSGDKHGQVAVWDFGKVYERTVWRMNRALTNNLSFLPSVDGMSCCSASSDGTLKVFDVETGLDRELLNMNPDGWIPGVSNERNWVMMYGMDVSLGRNLIAAGTSHGNVHFVDARAEKPIAQHQLHKKGNKVTSIHFSPVDQDLMVSASNDWTARLCDIRKLSSSTAASSDSKGKEVAGGPLELVRIEHPKVVNSAYFSPVTGRKLMTTCIDNRLRIWDYLLSVNGEPDRQIVHSHDFNRYLSPFRAEWDPKDPDERLIVIGRYISEDFAGTALHPIDLMDVGTGKLLDQLKDPNLTTICPVNKPHPRLDCIISGSSRSLYCWRPMPQDDKDAEGAQSSARGRDKDDKDALQGSAKYVFYDAGEGADTEKKKRKKSGAEVEVDEQEEKPKAKSKSLTKQEPKAKSRPKGESKAKVEPKPKTAGKKDKEESKPASKKDKQEEPKKKKKK